MPRNKINVYRSPAFGPVAAAKAVAPIVEAPVEVVPVVETPVEVPVVEAAPKRPSKAAKADDSVEVVADLPEA
jgi:hypothetical protein